MTSSTADPPGASRLPSLTGLRFFAVIAVFLYHSYFIAPFRDPEVTNVIDFLFSKANGIGVSFFFILSGFVIAWSYRPGERAVLFWRRRLVKIYPNHIVVWACAIVLALIVGQSFTATQAVTNLLLIQSWFPRFDIIYSLNEVSWSLACEVFFYLCFPLIFRYARRIPPARLWLAAGVVAALVFVMVFVATLLPDHPMDLWRGWLLYSLPAVRALEFALGVLMARIVLTGRWIPLGVLPASLLVGLGYLALLATPSPYHAVAPTVIPLALLIPAVASLDLRGRPSFLRNRTFVWLGEVSFAFYLIHRLLQVYGQHWLGGPGTSWDTPQAVGLIVLSFVLSLLLAWLLHVLVERPMMRRFAYSRRQRAERQAGQAGQRVPAGARSASGSGRSGS